jgi:hypothetical protein
MTSTFPWLASALLAAALSSGCSGGSGLLGGGVELPSDAPTMINNADPMARPVQVAWTSARAQRCGFNFDPHKLKANYLAYETRQGTPREQLPKIEQTYDTTFQNVSGKVSADPGYCTDRKSADIKGDLNRHLAGDYTPNLPKPKVASCGGLFDACVSGASEDPFDTTKFWRKQDLETVNRGR